MGSKDDLTDWRIWTKLKANYSHEIRVLDVNINTLQQELIRVITLPILPKYLDDKREDLIRHQRHRAILKRLFNQLDRNIKGVEATLWFQQNMILKQSSNY